MKTRYGRVLGTVGLLTMSAAALADEARQPQRHPQEPVGFITGAIIGGFAAGPCGAVAGAGLGTWLGNRVHRAAQAKRTEAQLADLKNDGEKLKDANAALASRQASLLADNQDLNARLSDLSSKVETVQNASEGTSQVLDGLQGDVLFRTGSAEVTPDIAHQIQVIAQVLSKAPELTVRLDGYADPRGSDDFNLQLSQARADAIRDLLMAAGVAEEAVEVNAYGKTQSVASDGDGFALERRVRLTLKMGADTSVAKVQSSE